MATNAVHPLADSGLVLAPIHGGSDTAPLRICLLVRTEPDAAAGPFMLLRELPGARVYLGAVCDAEARLQEWVEVWEQTTELRDMAFSGNQERLTNHTFDTRWHSEFRLSLASVPEMVIVTGMETRNPAPMLIKRAAPGAAGLFIAAEPSSWELCKDDALLESFGLPAYTTSPYRYLHEPSSSGAKTFVATTPDAPLNAHVQSLDRLKAIPEVSEIFNPHAGLLRVSRFSPLGLEEYLAVLEGRTWPGLGPGGKWFTQKGIYAEFQAWSGKAKGLPFLLHGAATPAERLNEILFLKLAALLGMFKEVRNYLQANQRPLLNLSPGSFTVQLPETSEPFPALWPAKCRLVKPGQAHPLKIKSTEQKYFLRMGRIEPSPFLPEGLGAHSFGIGSVRRRNVTAEADGTVLEGTLVAEDYLGLDPHDLLWFKLPIGEERLEFYAHVYTAESVGPREARFRTVPTKLPEAVVGVLKNTAAFARAPYEIWPLLSSPCDMHSLGIIAIRVLLANSSSNLPVIVDDVLGFARFLGKDPAPDDQLLLRLKAALKADPKVLDLLSPHALVEGECTPQQARSQVHLELWFEAVAWLLRLFPGAGSQSYCKNFGDVSPLALETVFSRPIQELETLTLRLRSVLAPTLANNEEIASVLLEQLANAPA